MFKSVSIKRFRGFKDFRTESFDRFNLFLGRNNAGKTALLESIFLLLGPTNPRLPLTLSAFRGIEQFRIDPEDLWGWLFYKRDWSQAITLEAKTDTGARRALAISLGEPKIVRLKKKSVAEKRRGPPTTATTEPGAGELIFQLTHESGKDIRSIASLRESGIAVESDGQIKMPTSVYVSARAANSSENPERFSELEAKGEEHAILPALQLLEPRLKRLAVLISGAGPMMHGDLGIGRLVPLPLMGEGMGRLLTLLLAIYASRDGMTLIDDVDTGLHYSVMPTVWSAIAKAARDAKAQVFATTHSWECMKAAHEAFSKEASYDLAIQRIDRNDDDVTATRFDREMTETALSSGMELR